MDVHFKEHAIRPHWEHFTEEEPDHGEEKEGREAPREKA
jgi:hypothetical protein